MLQDMRGAMRGLLTITVLTAVLALGGYLICDAQWSPFSVACAQPQ